MTVTADIIHAHIETDLDLYSIERLIEDAYSEVQKRTGLTTNLTYHTDGGGQYIFLDPPADQIDSVTENDVLLVADDDYELRWDGRAIRRVGSDWGETDVVYDGSDDEPRTDRVVIDLVHLAIQYEALESSSDGDYSERHLKYQEERNRLIDTLASGFGFA